MRHATRTINDSMRSRLRIRARAAAAIVPMGLAGVGLAACGDDGGVAQAPSDDPLAVEGQGLFSENGCSGCHSTSGGDSRGPHLDAVFGEEVDLADGSTVVADEEYLARSIQEPSADVVDGYQPIMPSLGLSDNDVEALVAYIRSLG